MPLTARQLYAVHVANSRSVDAGRLQVGLQLKNAIASGNQPTTDTLLRVYLLLAAAGAETRLRKLMYEPNGFTAVQRAEILRPRGQINRWKKAVELAFRTRYNRPRAALSALSIGEIPFHQYRTINALLDRRLAPLIELRNSLAHGQWVRLLNNDEDEISQQQMAALNQENALSAHFKSKLIYHLADVVHDLVSGGVAFERDYNRHFGLINSTSHLLDIRRYPEWEADLVAKYERGKAKRAAGAIVP